ncbi:MAG: J domain-containing protein [Gammaproteobacteria bacterium]|nr:J domain-containing protein [Gammaproteobacteria bacterium]
MEPQTDHITAYPLCWPPGRSRTPDSKRQHGRFGNRNDRGYGTVSITLSKATNRVLAEIEKFTKPGQRWRAENVIVSTNLVTRLDGLPRSGQRTPDDRAVAVYFELDGKSRCIPCDNYLRIEDNLAAVAATLDALRTIERHGSEMFEAAFTGFTALPRPDTISIPHWRTVFDTDSIDIEEVKQLYRKAIGEVHPDRGGNEERFNLVKEAWRLAQQELS